MKENPLIAFFKRNSLRTKPDSDFIPAAISAIQDTNVPPQLRTEIDRRIGLYRELSRNGVQLNDQQLSLIAADMEEPGF